MKKYELNLTIETNDDTPLFYLQQCLVDAFAGDENIIEYDLDSAKENGKVVLQNGNWISFKRNNEWKVSSEEVLKYQKLADEVMNSKQ